MRQPLSASAVLVAALLGTSHLALGQQAPGSRPSALPAAPAANRAATGRITGTVTDAATGKPVSYATVAVLDAATGKVINGGVCGDDGKFVLPGIPAGTYTVQVSFVGYKNEERPGVVVAAGAPLDLGKIALAVSAQKLGEVVVVAQKPLIEERVDRTVYNAENDQTTRGGDATDVLKRVPLLSVDLDGNVSLRGSSSIKVLINNKPSAIAATSVADALRQIPADQIKTVEVITSPSAKYDAEGSGGIINIITKQNNLSGGTLGVDASIGTRSSNLGVQGAYRTGKMGFSLGGFGRAGYNTPGSFSNEQITKEGSGTVLSTRLQTADTRLNQGFGRAVLGWDYDIDKHNSLTASLSYGARNSHNYQDELTTLSSTPQTAPVRDVRDVNVTDNSGTVDASLNYTHTFEKPQHEFSLLTLYSRNDRTNNFTNTVLNPEDLNTVTGRRLNENPSSNQEFTVQADYQAPITKTQLLEFGAKDIVRRVNSDYTTYEATGANGAYTPAVGVGLTNNFNYNQNVAAAYVTYTLGLPKGFTLKPGLRYEYTSIDAKFGGKTPVKNIPDYDVTVPSVNISRKLANGNVIKLAYNKRIQRPSLQFLNPNRQQPNPLIITEGNPKLQPEYTNNYELGYSTLVKRANVNFTAFVRNTTGSIQSVRTPYLENGQTTGIQLVSYGNIGQEDAYGGSVFASINNSKLSLNGGVDAYYAVLRNNVSDVNYNASNEGLVASGRVFGSYKLTDLWGLQAFAFYRGQQVQLQGYQSGFGIYSLSIKRDFADKKGSIGFGAENFFTSGINIRNEVRTPLLDQTSTNVLHNMSFKVNISYRIGKMSVAPTRGAKSINNDDLKGGGEGGGGGDLGGGAGGGAPAGGGRPAGMPAGARPGGAGAPAGTPGVRPAGTPTSAPTNGSQPQQLNAPAGISTDSTQTQPAQVPATTPAAPNQTAQPADSTQRQQPAAPATTPVNAPSPGTTTPGGITPAGSPGGRP
jgi:outer membrane receptor protein involved in Fe transport